MTWMVLWSIALFALALAWAKQRRHLVRATLRCPPLTPSSYSGPMADPPLVSFIIAGKDEEANIERAVRSLLRQDYPRLELIVVNDRSRDRTPEILEALKAEDKSSRLQVIHITELRDGWFGKNNAMREGVAAAHGEWLGFGDADCEHLSECSLSMAVRHAVEWKYDFLSILPILDMRSLWEKIIQPVASLLLMLWFNPKKVNSPKSRVGYANGPFMLMTRRCYEIIGGHEAVKTELMEDIHMGRRAKERGQRLFVCRNEGLLTARMYTSFAQMWHGWSRIFYGSIGTFRQLGATVVTLFLTGVFPYASLLAAVVAGALTVRRGIHPGWYLVGATAALAIAAQLMVLIRYYRTCQARTWQAFTYVIGAAVCLGILINAMLKLRRRSSVTWRGTTYRGDTVLTPANGLAPNGAPATSPASVQTPAPMLDGPTE
jgi:chlorobactene glucosyltransferase